MKERIVWIGGNHTRHLYYINQIAKQFDVVGGIIQDREVMKPLPPEGLDREDEANWTRHFLGRATAETHYFMKQSLPHTKLLRVDKQTLNSDDSVDFIKSLKPDVVLVFGIGMIREPLLSVLPDETLNMHLGLSPRYRGAATLFWPFYFLEPNWAGVTFHYLAHSPDAGTIVHQTRPELYINDGIHDVACHAVMKATQDACRLLEIHQERGKWQKFSQKPESGKNFLESDFKPQYLRMIYSQYDDKIVGAYLDGKITPKEPKLKTQW
jgi:folate-dependent phosphoribosylglycinamide formyltransferase PurN